MAGQGRNSRNDRGPDKESLWAYPRPPIGHFWKTGVSIGNLDNVFVTSEWFGPSVPRLPEPIIAAPEVVLSGVVLQSKKFRRHRLEK